ncbi:MAG TPA: hypothetical protein VMU27_01800 [Candidatus Paceibacterota bacterium]|nr:hypothetical protein [Candidatus Paceibacterota bacterium]
MKQNIAVLAISVMLTGGAGAAYNGLQKAAPRVDEPSSVREIQYVNGDFQASVRGAGLTGSLEGSGSIAGHSPVTNSPNTPIRGLSDS